MPKKAELEYWNIHPDYADAIIEAWDTLKLQLQHFSASNDFEIKKGNSSEKGSLAFSDKLVKEFFSEFTPEIKKWVSHRGLKG